MGSRTNEEVLVLVEFILTMFCSDVGLTDCVSKIDEQILLYGSISH